MKDIKSCKEVDDSIFSGELLYDDESREALKSYVARWSRAIADYELGMEDDPCPEWKIRAWEGQHWVGCSSLEYDYSRKLWRHVQRWSSGNEDWLYDIEVRINGIWYKLNGGE